MAKETNHKKIKQHIRPKKKNDIKVNMQKKIKEREREREREKREEEEEERKTVGKHIE